MRALISFFLSLFITLNAANAAIHGVYDAAERGAAHGFVAGHAAHFPQHDHDPENAADASAAPGAGVDDLTGPSAEHHHHCHVHPSFSSLVSGVPTVPVLAGADVLSVRPAAALVSAMLPRLERPPRAPLA